MPPRLLQMEDNSGDNNQKGINHKVNTIAGRIQHYISFWESITRDRNILDMVKGCHVTFTNDEVHKQLSMPFPIKLNHNESVTMSKEIDKLCSNGDLEQSLFTPGQFLSIVFLRPKPDGSFRMILNLKKLNQHVEYNKFKMDTLHSILKLVTPKCYMATLDLKDAYYMIPIAIEHRKYIRFDWKGTLYQYTCLPNGLCSAPRLFTKLMKPCYAKLRLAGHIVSGYIDDSYIQGQTFNNAMNSLVACKELLSSLGFLIHPDKSMRSPSQCVKVLGFEVNSVNMTVSLTHDKKAKLKDLFLETISTFTTKH